MIRAYYLRWNERRHSEDDELECLDPGFRAVSILGICIISILTVPNLSR